MRAWCPRCDAVRPGQTACPTCGTSLATLEDPASPDTRPETPPPADAPAPPAPSRLRVALAAATLVVAGLAFVAGRSAARSAPPAATAAPATSTTTPEPGADFRELGWTDRVGDVTVTAVKASRSVADELRETVAVISFRFDGLPPGRRVLAVRGLRLLDSGGGAFSSVEQRPFGSEGGAPVTPSDDPDTYTLVTGPAPRLGSLARIELTGLVVDRPRDNTVELDTAGPWPAGPRLREIDPGPRDTVLLDPGFTVTAQQPKLKLRVASAFVGGGRVVVLVDASSGIGFRGFPGSLLPLSAELRAGDRVLCSRPTVFGDDVNQNESALGIVLVCPTRPATRLTVAVGAGVQAVDLDATLSP